MEIERSLKEVPILEGAYKNRWLIFMGLLATFLLSSIFYFKQPSQELLQKQYANVENAFFNWQQNPLDENLEKVLASCLTKAKGASFHYDGKLAEQYLKLKKFTKAEPFIERVAVRLQGKDLVYGDFSLCSLLIEKKELKEALELSLRLKDEINKAKAPFLYAVNLMRILELQNNLLDEAEKETLQELKAFIAVTKTPFFLNAFQENGMSISNFLEKKGSF